MKKALIIIGVIIGLILIVAIFLPKTSSIERSIVIQSPVEVVYDQVADLEKYLTWSPWSEKDPDMKVEWKEQRAGEGAGYSWEGNEDVGKGTMVIEEAIENTSLRNKLDFGAMGGYGLWAFVETENGVEVTWTMESDLDRPLPLIGRYFGVFMDFDAAIGPDFEHGLENLKQAAESIPIEAEIEIEEMDVVDITFLAIKDSVAISDLSMKMGAVYEEIVDMMNEQDIDIRAQPICVYHKWDESGGYTVFEAGIPIAASKEVKLKGRVKKKTIPGGPAVRVVHMGSYESAGKAHYAIDEWISQNGRELRGGPWEVYVTGPANEPDTSKWVTEIYYPLL